MPANDRARPATPSIAGIEGRDGAAEVPLGVAGLYGWEAGFERVLHAVRCRISDLGADDTSRLVQFPPVISRAAIDRVRYRNTFPHLLGEVTVWDGVSDSEPVYGPSALVLTPAACYHVYPLASTRQGRYGETFEIESWCFRNEAGQGVARLSAFRMREFVKIGEPDTVHQWREAWVQRALKFVQSLGLQARTAPASDPFFGARSHMFAARQHAQEAKYEVLVPAADGDDIALASANYHHSHFGDLFELRLSTGDAAHTACAAFGLERLTSALFSKHGSDPSTWPNDVQKVLGGQAN